MLINNKIFDKTGIPFLGQILKVSSASQKVTASNIANVATKGYGAKKVEFKEELKNYLGKKQRVTPVGTDSRHIAPQKPQEVVAIKEGDNSENSSGINNVDIEKEMVNLAENQLLYEFGAQRLARTFAALKMAIRGKSS